jgi:hypothetical protein
LTGLARGGTLRAMTELPGGTAGCDVCGVLLDAEKAPLHHAWHQTEDERLEGLAQTLRELFEMVRDRRV